MVHPYFLVALLHCRWKSTPLALQHNLLLRDTAIAWREVRKALKLSPFMPRHSRFGEILASHRDWNTNPSLSGNKKASQTFPHYAIWKQDTLTTSLSSQKHSSSLNPMLYIMRNASRTCCSTVTLINVRYLQTVLAKDHSLNCFLISSKLR